MQKLPQLTLRDLFWLVALVAMGSLLSAGSLVAAPPLRDGWKPGIGPKDGDLSVSISYGDDPEKRPMLVLTNGNGAAAVVFTSPIVEPGVVGVGYRYRYESFDGKTKNEGERELFEQRHEDGTMGGDVRIVIADLSVGWSMADKDRGWFYYSPEHTRIHPADGRLFKPRTVAIAPGGKKSLIPALDLQRFRPQAAASDE
jgi:hypothetical protein